MSKTDDASAPALPYVKNLIAVVGCDGTGKSTLTHGLVKHLRERRAAKWCYLGLISGEMGEQIKRLPLVGERLERYLDRRAQRAQNVRNELPGLFAAAVMYGFSLRRAGQLRKVVELARHGTVVITDRYPQNELPGFHYDGPGIGMHRSRGRIVSALAHHEQEIYDHMARVRPQLVVRLTVDIATARIRKPDHDPAELRDKIAIMQKLHFNGARIVEIDTRHAYGDVFRKLVAVVETTLEN